MPEFFDTYQDIGGGKYVDAKEKDALIENGVPFEITDVVYQSESKFGARFVCRVVLPDFEDENGEGEDRLMSFGANSVESRDRMLNALMEYLKDPEATPPSVRLEKAGRATLIVKA